MKIKRKLHRVTAAALGAVMMFCMTATGASAQVVGESLSFEPVSGAQTVVTEQGGALKTYDGVPDAAQWQNTAAVNRVSGYEVRCDGDALLTVELHNIKNTDGVGAQAQPMNAYFAVEFALDDHQTAFVTGLTSDNVQTLQDAMIQAHQSSTPFTLTDAGFIDAEQSGKSGVDKHLSWAAASSNLLTYTGWAAYAGFNNEDEVFSAFASAFEDKISVFGGGLPWYFNGIDLWDDVYADYVAKAKSGTGGYASAYNVMELGSNDTLSYTDVYGWKRVTKALRDGKGVSLTLYDAAAMYDDSLDFRAVTCWGYVTDDRFDEFNIAHYKTLILSDSASDLTGSKSRSSAPNRMTAADVQLVKDEEFEEIDAYDVILTGYEKYRLYDAITLDPYSADLPYETSALATRDLNTTADFTPDELEIKQPLSFDFDYEPDTMFPSDQPLTVSAELFNCSLKEHTGDVSAKVVVKNQAGRAVFNRTVSCYLDGTYEYLPEVEIGKLPAGKYTAEVTANPSKTIREAYYYNNTRTLNFEVRDPATDVSKLKLITGKPRLSGERVVCDVRFEGLSDELRDRLSGYKAAQVSYTYYGDEDGASPLDASDFQVLSELPCAFYLHYTEDCKLRVKLLFPDAPPLYLESDMIKFPFPSAELLNPEYYNDDYYYTDTVEHGLTPVRRNVRSLANGEVMKVAVLHHSDPERRNSFTLQYHLEAVNRFGKRVVLTKPASVKLGSDDDEKYLTFSRFDYPIPQGTYTLKVVADNDVLIYDYVEPYTLRAGSGNDGGDLNADGKINIDDVTLLQKYLSNQLTFTEAQLRDADVNGDGVVDIIDATVIQQYLSGENFE